MMPRSCKYALLLASLPRHPLRLFSAKETVISRIKLEQQLLLLDAADAVELQRIEALLSWSSLTDESDAVVIKKCQDMIDLITDAFLKQLALWHLELRTLLSALRLRHAGVRAPGKNRFQGFGIWPDYIEKNWQESDFGVGRRLPWLIEAQGLLVSDKPFELEKFLLELVWRQYATAGSQHYFDFPAVVIYVLRWDLTHRWLNYNADKAVECFNKLVEAGLAGLDGI